MDTPSSFRMIMAIPRSRLLVLLLAFLMGETSCSGSGPKEDPPPTKNTREPPVLVALPAAGTYHVFSLGIEVGSKEKGLTYYYGVNETPHFDIGYPEKVQLRIGRSARIVVNVRDESGTLWGPYTFDYSIEPPSLAAACDISARTRYYYRTDETIDLDVNFSFANGLSRLYLWVDNIAVQLGDPQTLTPTGTIETTAGPVQVEGIHDISCEIRDPRGKSVRDSTQIFIDGTPPTGTWVSSGGAFSHDTWPFEFSLQASDAGSGVEQVALCKGGGSVCLELDTLDGSLFSYATVLTGESSFQATLSPFITDRAGNRAVISDLVINALSFGEPPPLAPLPVTLVTEAEANLNDALVAEGRTVTIADVMSPDLMTTFSSSALPLTPGWNDFLFRQAGRREWESFGIYRAGIAVTYPASTSPWLVYASQSSTPSMQGVLIDGPLPAGPGGQWGRLWFDVPHIWFVKDVNANSRWDDGDELWTLPVDGFDGPFLARLAPVNAVIAQRMGLVPSGSAMKSVICEVCGAGGALFFERRLTSYAYPESHTVLPAVLFSELATQATVSVGAESGERCDFFWDENADGLANGKEPRVFGACDSSTWILAKQAPLSAVFSGGRIRISGLPYGGMATGELRMGDGPAPIYREAVYEFKDVNGTGEATTALTIPLNLPYSIWISNGTESVSIALPVSSASQTMFLSVRDEGGAPISAVGVLQGSGVTYGRVIQISDGQVTVGLPPLQNGVEAYALRQGYLSVAVPVTGSTMSLRVLGPTVTGRVAGTVKDSFYLPISQATLTWTSGSYTAKAFSGADGGYSLPASGGTGILRISAAGPYRRESYFWLDVTTETVQHDIVLPDGSGPSWPLGANLGLWPNDLSGAYPAQAYVSDTYYAARVTSGEWMVHSWYGPARRASLPGALPPLLFGSMAPVLPPNDVALALLDQSLRCGARLQLGLSFGGARIDSSCWGWFASDAYQEFFLGRPDPATGFPSLRGLGVMNAGVVGAAVSLDLVDLLLDRKIRVPINLGMVRTAVPTGIYAVYKSGGARATDKYGAPAVIKINAVDNTLMLLVLP